MRGGRAGEAAAFGERAQAQEVFRQLEADIRLLAREPDPHLERPVLLQHPLVDAVELLDPKCGRFAAERRTRLDAPGA